jgi:hypothetical protein
MGWIKRNLFLLVFGLVALGALGGAGFYIYRGYTNNAQQADSLTQIYDALKTIADKPLQPGTTNTEVAKGQEKQLRDWIRQATARFHPLAPIPTGTLTSETFGTALETTIDQLTQEAKDNSVKLPPQPPYCYSFQVQHGLMNISSGLAPLAQQLGEVKAITEVLLVAQVNNLDGIQRIRVSDDDVTKGAAADYTDRAAVTNGLAIVTPYVVTFRGFSPELARVVAGFSTSTNPFIVKSISVQQVDSAESEATSELGNGVPPAQNYGGGAARSGRYGGGGGAASRYQVRPPANEAPGEPPGAGGGLQTAIKERLLRVTMEVDVVKLVLKS